MKIVHLLAYYGDYVGGIQNYAKELAAYQKKQGNDVEIITSNLFGKQKKADGIKTTKLFTPFCLFRVPFMPTLVFHLLGKKMDVLHVHLPLPGFDFAAGIKKLVHPKTKLIITIHNYIPATGVLSRILSGFHNKISMPFALGLADTIITTTKPFADSLPYKIPSAKHKIVPLGVDFELFKPCKPRKKNTVLFVGRMIPEKGFHILMQAMREVHQEIPTARLLAVYQFVYGYEEYYAKCRSLDTGFLVEKPDFPHERLPELYSESTVFVMPSLDIDSFGIVLLEALACNCPVICTDLPGPASIVQKESGLIVKKGSATDLSQSIKRVLEGNAEFEDTREVVAKNFSWKTVNQEVFNIYET